ncbi:unnamed protein product [Peniophora sp. CBMAI 1063]|nr:unnamed protein product [Peniophora sp. CBMAI 1063]
MILIGPLRLNLALDRFGWFGGIFASRHISPLYSHSFIRMHSLLSTAVIFSLGVVANAESHTVTFINNCGFGTPTLSVQGSVVSTGSDYTSNGQIEGGTAYLDYDTCSTNGGNCTGVELTLSNGISAADVTLVSPYAFSVASCMSFYNGCDGTGFACTEADCPGAFLTPTDSSATTITCQSTDVNLAVTFCDCSASSGSSGTGGDTTSSTTTTTTTAQATPKSSTPAPQSSTTPSSTQGSSSHSSQSTPSTPAGSSTAASGTASMSSPTSGQNTASAIPTTMLSQSGSDSVASSPTASSSSTAIAGETGARNASNRSSNTGAIAGGVVGGVLGLLALLAGLWLCRRRGRARGSHKPEIDDFEVVDPFPGHGTPQARMLFGEKSGQGATSSTTLLRDGDVLDISHPPPSSEASRSTEAPPPTTAPPGDHTRVIEDVVLRTLQGNGGQPRTPSAGADPASSSPPVRSGSGDPADVSVIEGIVHRVLQGFLGGQHGDEPPPTYVR